MGSYDIRCYKSTGFDGVNIPDSLSLLNQFQYKDYGSVSIRQERGLAYIRLQDKWTECSDYDYVKVGTDANAFYYSCVPTMIADDVFELTLIPDYILSAGGIENALSNVIGGMTSRFIPSDDTLGYYEESDALLAPALPLNISQEWINPGGTDSTTFVESTIDLARTCLSSLGRTYSDADGNSVTVPSVTYIGGQLPNGDTTPAVGTSYSIGTTTASSNPVTQLYDLDDSTAVDGGLSAGDTAKAGMEICRTLGIEQGILSQFIIPNVYVNKITRNAQGIKDLKVVPTNTSVYTEHLVTRLSGKTGVVESSVNYDYTSQGESIVWRRILTSEYTKFGLITASGERCEYNPADILETGKTSPTVRWIADPRPDGKPYFRFLSVNSDSGTGPFFFRSCVSGLQWKQVPLLYTGVSGSALNTLSYENSRQVTDTNYRGQMESMQLAQNQAVDSYNLNTRLNILDTAANAASGMANSVSVFGVIGSAAGAAMTGISNQMRSDLAYEQSWQTYDQNIANAERSYNAVKQSELSALAVQNTISVPTITIPYNSDVIRDFYGNGVLVYRYTYDSRDIARINKILTMYGYKHTKPIEKQDFFNRKNFNYVECSGLSVTGFNRTFCQGIAAQLNNGVRVWHVKPSATYYENKAQNPLK